MIVSEFYRTLSQALEALEAQEYPSILLFSMTLHKYRIFPWPLFKDDLDPRMGWCEVVIDDTARPCMEFDEDIRDHKSSIEEFVTRYFYKKYNQIVRCYWKIAKCAQKVGMHLIVNGCYFKNCWKSGCLKMARRLKRKLGIKCDRSIYRKHGGLRVIGQYKFKDGVYKRRLVDITPGRLDNYYLRHSHDDQSIELAPEISDKDSGESDNISRYANPLVLPQFYGLALWNYQNGYYNYRKITGCSWWCGICKRWHESDNAYGYINQDNEFIFKCRRAYENDPEAHLRFKVPSKYITETYRNVVYSTLY